MRILLYQIGHQDYEYFSRFVKLCELQEEERAFNRLPYRPYLYKKTPPEVITQMLVIPAVNQAHSHTYDGDGNETSYSSKRRQNTCFCLKKFVYLHQTPKKLCLL